MYGISAQCCSVKHTPFRQFLNDILPHNFTITEIMCLQIQLW
uniref:Uncharacterized protein n=1 Tax=Anguilla anguilla TaxID=7936 RepID=A0A0E9SJ33_ANGAN